MIRGEIVLILKELLLKNKSRKLHIVLPHRRFYNGVVQDYSAEESISFKDDKLGYIPILHKNIIDIEPWVAKE